MDTCLPIVFFSKLFLFWLVCDHSSSWGGKEEQKVLWPKALDCQKMPDVLLVDRCFKLYLNWGLVVEDKERFPQQGMRELYDENKLL